MALADEALMELCSGSAQQNSDSEKNKALSVLIARYMPLIAIKAHKMQNTNVEAQDLESEGLLGLMSAIRHYDVIKGKFRSFADVCIENKMRSALQKAKSPMLPADSLDLENLLDEKATAEEQLIRREQNQEISSLLSKTLSKLELEVILLYLDGFDYAKIADKLGISVKSADNAMQRARKKLKIQLASKSE